MNFNIQYPQSTLKSDENKSGSQTQTQNTFNVINTDSGSVTALAPNSQVNLSSGNDGLLVSATDNDIYFRLTGKYPPATNGSSQVRSTDGWTSTPSPTINLIFTIFTDAGTDKWKVKCSGIDMIEYNPTILVHRGFTYRFENQSTYILNFPGPNGTIGTVQPGDAQFWTVPNDTVDTFEYRAADGGVFDLAGSIKEWTPTPSPTINLIFTILNDAGTDKWKVKCSGIDMNGYNPDIFVYRGFTYRFENQSTYILNFPGPNGTIGTVQPGDAQLWTVPNDAVDTFAYRDADDTVDLAGRIQVL